MPTPLIISLIIIPISSFFLYLPWQQHLKLFHPGHPTTPHLNLDSCSRVGPSEFGWCAEPVIVKQTGFAYFACDESRLWWDPVRFVWQDTRGEGTQGSVWAWDLSNATAQPFQLDLASPHTEPFHPLSISAAVDENVNATILLVSNHPHARAPGVIEVFKHNHALTPTPREAAHVERIQGAALDHRSPFQVKAVPEQWSQGDVPLPSFLFSTLPDPEKAVHPDRTSLSTPPSIHTYLRELFLPTHPRQPSTIYLHLSSAYTTRGLFSTGASHPTLPPLLSTWDGGGSLGGSNATLHAIYTTSTDAKHSLLEQWDQHWVRGMAYGTESVTNRRTWTDVRVRWPDFVTFWNSPFRVPIRGIDVDSYGRVWSVSALDEGMSERRIEQLRNGSSVAEAAEPGALVQQTTFLHRLGASIAHPWEVERIGSAKKRGIWLPKEFYSTLIYRRGGPAQLTSSGFLPHSPTGIAVDEPRKRVIVTSSWDDGVAVCDFKQGWVEM